jgi:hypothetical protein
MADSLTLEEDLAGRHTPLPELREHVRLVLGGVLLAHLVQAPRQGRHALSHHPQPLERDRAGSIRATHLALLRNPTSVHKIGTALS